MRKCVCFPLVLVCLLQFTPLRAQEFFINADAVSSFVWRGMKFNDACLQPSMGVNAGGFSFMAWGSTDFNTYGSHVDLFMSYNYKKFKFQVADYFVLNDPDDSFDYFDYKGRTTNHMFEANVTYTVSERFPLAVKWSTFFAGADYNDEDGGRSYSSYLEFAYPFTYKGFDFRAEAGMTFWEGLYSDRLNVMNLGFSMGKKITVSDRITLPVSGKIILNPYEQKSHFVLCVSF